MMLVLVLTLVLVLYSFLDWHAQKHGFALTADRCQARAGHKAAAAAAADRST